MRNKLYKILAAGIALAITFTLSCSGGGDDPPDGGGGNGEGITITYGIENVTDSSFTRVEKWYECQQNGTLKEETETREENYSINGKTLSFQGIDFSGNSSSLIGTWTSDIFCKENNDDCDREVYSKLVFTQNSLTATMCKRKIGEYERTENGVVVGKRKVIDCGTLEETRGTQTVRVKYFGTEVSATYNGKTCNVPFEGFHSKSQMQKACTDAYNSNGNYQEILYKEFNDCLKKNNFPEWFH